MRRTVAGFTLIELMVSVFIITLVLTMGIPYMGDWVRRAGVRTAAESIQNGLRVAQQEAIRRNTPVEFALVQSVPLAADAGNASLATNTDDWKGWMVRVRSDNYFVQGDNVSANAADAEFTSSDAKNNILRFSGFGQVRNSDDAVLTSTMVYRIASPKVSEVRCVLVTPGASVRMCNPAVASSDPRGCGAAADACPLN
ncbi:Tfp pilus assembly protein FimT/FimU [Uliginosibacterium sp. sgz301328]|uniref:pilus assembly FimT family protein n=1 Tax=Uliginosibacterium sp. sgz301328 TaxID=3243764 RepID=UPI00359D41C3